MPSPVTVPRFLTATPGYESAKIDILAQSLIAAWTAIDSGGGGGGGPGVTDGDKGDITVSATGTSWNVDPLAITTAKLANNAVTSAKVDASIATAAALAAVDSRLVAVEALAANDWSQVTHGSTAGTARPATAVVYWVGSVAPTNAIAHDLWYDTDEG